MAISRSSIVSEEPRQSSGKFIGIPQKCYGLITPETPDDILGLYTAGLHTCSSIVVMAHDESNRCFFLCHADDQTDLSDSTHGLAAWINKIPEDLYRVEIQYDTLCDRDYATEILQIVQQIEGRDILISPIDTDRPDITIFRENGDIYRGGEVFFDYQKETSNIEEYVGDILDSFPHGRRHPPICAYNGLHTLNINDEEQQGWVKDIASYPPDFEDAAEDVPHMTLT